MLVDDLKQKILQSLRGNTPDKDVLRVVLGEVQAIEAREGGKPSDEQVQKVIRKLIASNEETIKMAAPPGYEAGNIPLAQKLAEENRILTGFLPHLWDQAEILAFFSKTGNADYQRIRDAKNDGQATGIAVKALKEAAAPVSGGDVSAVVKQIRNH